MITRFNSTKRHCSTRFTKYPKTSLREQKSAGCAAIAGWVAVLRQAPDLGVGQGLGAHLLVLDEPRKLERKAAASATVFRRLHETASADQCGVHSGSPTDDYLQIGTYGGESFRKAHHGPGIYGFNWWFNATGPRHAQALTWPDAPSDTIMSLGYGGNSSAIIPSLGVVIVCASGAWDDLKPGNPASKINLALRVAARAAGYHPSNTALLLYFPPP